MRSLLFQGLFLFTGLSLAVAASGQIESFAVFNQPYVGKIRSFICDKPSQESIGSGTLLTIENDLYVLTSAHVVFHGGKSAGICHQFETGRRKLKLEPIAINSGNGLALLKIQAAESVNLPSASFEQMSSLSRVNPSTPICLSGWPYTSSTVLNDCGSRILNYKSNRSILPLIDHVYEVHGHSEFGMSGGALLSARGEYLGLISHQYLKSNVGRIPTAKEYQTTDSTNDEIVALIVPREEIVPWLDSVLSHEQTSQLLENLSDQLNGVRSISMNGIKFTESKCSIRSDSKSGSGQGAGIGGSLFRGGQGVGIGGSLSSGDQGIGIGGREPDHLETCSIELSIDSSSNQPWPFESKTWVESIRKFLDSSKSAKISQILIDGDIHTVEGLMSFMSLLKHGGEAIH